MRNAACRQHGRSSVAACCGGCDRRLCSKCPVQFVLDDAYCAPCLAHLERRTTSARLVALATFAVAHVTGFAVLESRIAALMLAVVLALWAHVLVCLRPLGARANAAPAPSPELAPAADAEAAPYRGRARGIAWSAAEPEPPSGLAPPLAITVAACLLAIPVVSLQLGWSGAWLTLVLTWLATCGVLAWQLHAGPAPAATPRPGRLERWLLAAERFTADLPLLLRPAQPAVWLLACTLWLGERALFGLAAPVARVSGMLLRSSVRCRGSWPASLTRAVLFATFVLAPLGSLGLLVELAFHAVARVS